MRAVYLEEISIEKISPTLFHSFKRKLDKKWNKNTEILVVSFKGMYRDGSEGNPDAQYISAVVDFGFEIFSAERVVVDFSELNYTFGNSIYNALNKFRRFSLTIVVGDACRESLTSLWQFMGARINDITDVEGFFDELKGALKYSSNQKPWFKQDKN